jgi:hypothetical protein
MFCINLEKLTLFLVYIMHIYKLPRGTSLCVEGGIKWTHLDLRGNLQKFILVEYPYTWN